MYAHDYTNRAKKAPVTTQAYNNGDLDASILIGSARNTDSDTVNNEEEDRRMERKAYRENQKYKNNNNQNQTFYDGIQNKNGFFIPRGPQDY